MKNTLRPNNILTEKDFLKDHETIKDMKTFDSDDEVSYEFVEELDKIHSEMLNGNCVKFKDVDELAKRYCL